MNIYALKGHKVKFIDPKAGYKFHQENALKYLQLNHEYTIEKTKVYNSSTDVWIIEIPDITFNSCQFKDITNQREDHNKNHPDYEKYHLIY